MFTFSGLVSIPRTMDLFLHLKFCVTVSRLHWSCEFSLGFLNVFKRLKLREKMVSLSRERRSHFSYHSVSDCLLSPSSTLPRLWIGSSGVFPAGQLCNRCWKVSVTSEEHGLDEKWWVTGDWSQLMGEKMTLWWTGLVPEKEIHHFEKEMNGVHPAALLAPGQQLALKPPDEAFHCVIVRLFISSVH